MADIYSILSDETLDKIAAGGDLYESMADNELDAVIAMGQQEGFSPAPATPAATSLTMPTTEGDLFPVEQTSDIEEAAPQYEQNRVGAKIGQIQNIISPEDAKSMSTMGAGVKGALRVQQQGGPTAYDDDGSISSWLGNMWNTIAYNSSGKVTAKSTNRHLQSILRGTVKVDGKEVPLTQLPDEALDNLADSAGWNGWKGWLFGLRSDDSILQYWDRTAGANIKDPVARKAARVKYAQDVARGMVEQQESEKMAASVELENRPKHFGADVGAGFAETASYMAPYMIPHTYGIVAGLIEAGDRANELLSDAYEVDNEGNIRIKALRDSTGAAIAKGAARGVVAPLVERFGGDLAMGVLGKIPLVKSMGDKIIATTAGKAVDKWIKSMSRLGKYTGMQSMPAEMIEEFEDQVLDAGLGLNLREGEKVGTTALSRAGGAAKEFFTLDNLQELAESMILIQVLGGGAAYMNDRRITKHLDNLIANEAGIDPKDLAGFSLEEKQAAYRAFVEGLSEAEVSRRFNRGAEAINKLANSIREGRDWMDDFRDSAMRMMDEDSSAAPAQPQDTSPRMTKGDILTAAEAKQQEMEWEMLPPEKADEVAPGTIVVLPDGTKLMRQKRGVSKWGIVGTEKNSIALADSAAGKLLENGFRIFSKDKKGKQNETRANETQPQPEQTQPVVPPAGETARSVEAGEATPEVGGEVASTETPITPPTSTPTETEVNTPPTTTESVEDGSGAAESEEDGEDSVDIDYDSDLPPDSLEDESESSVSVKDEILPLADLEEPLADEEEEVLSSEDLEKPTRETKVPKLLTLPDTQEKFDELTRRLHTPIAQGGVSEKSQKGKAVQAEIERMKKAGWKPSEAQPLPPTNRLRRADGTDPLVDKTQTTTPTTAAEPIDNETATTYNTEIKTPPTSNNKGETTNEEPERTQEGSKDESTVQVPESGDDFSRLQEASRAMPDSERGLYRTGRKRLDGDDLGRASSKRSEKRRGRIVDVLRKRVDASNGGRNLSGVKTLSARKKGKVLEYFNFGRTDGQTFRDVFEVVRNYLPNGELVDPYDNYGDDVKCFLSEDGLCGFAVEADGNLVSVFSLRPGSLKAMKNSILAAGATHLDAYASKNQDLAEIFSDVLGFKVASRMDYNMDYDHDNIAANHGNPDVVFMVKPEKNQVIEEKHYGKDDYEVAQYNQKYQAKRRSHEDKLRHNRIKGGLDALKDNSIANKDSVALKQILADIDYMRKGDDAKWFMAFGLKDDSDILSLENAIQGRLNGNDIYALSQTAENDWRKVNFERLESENANERDAAFRALAKAYISNLNAYNKAQASQEIDEGVKAELENRVRFLTSAISNMSESDRQKFNKLVDDAESDLANKGTAEYQEVIGDRDELMTSEGERNDEENDLGAGGSGVTVNKQFEETKSATQSRRSRSGNRDNGYISLEDGNVVWHNALGDIVKKVPANVLDVVGKNNAEVKSLVGNLRKGQTVYMSVKDVESSIERDRRFTEDKDYQAWLKKQKANDAERMREKYEQESAKIAAGIGRNFIGGMKVKVVDREYIEGEDGENDRHLRDPKTKNVVGTWNRETNELKLFRGANASTLVHELGGHAAYQFAQEQAAQGDKTLLNKMNECIDYALNSPKMKPLIEDIRSRYPEATEEVMRDEIFAALMERNSPIMQDLTKTLQGKAWYNRTWQAIKDAFRAMLTKMGLNKADLRGIDKMQPEEFMSWLDRTMADGKNLGAIAGMDFGDGGTPTRKMQVGELGAYALGRTADRAKEMELAGTSRREIWDKTGWWKGRDGMWRFEIPDPAALKLTQDNIKALRQHIRDNGFVSMRLGNLKGIDDLLWAHPDLEDISFSIVPDKAVNGAEGYYDEASNKILISRRLLSDLKALNSTLVHEIQHAVQVREGFDRGASFDLDVFKNAETEEERLAIANNYLNSAGEVEARLAEARRNMTPEQRRATPPWEMYDVAEEEQNVGRDNGGRYEAHKLRKATTTTTATSFMDDTRSRGEKLEEKLIDSTAPIKSIQKEIDNHARASGEEGVEEVVNADGSTDWRNSTDFIEAKDKENGHLERNLRELKTRYIDPAMEALAKAIRPGQERADLITDFNLYLQCKHAAARNRKIANDREEVYTPDYSEGMGMVTLSDGRRVGLSENVANQILAKMSREYGAKFRNFEDAAQSVYKMLEADLHNRHKSGLLSTEDWLKYMERRQGIMDWGTYIPLKTDLQDTEGEAYRTFTTSLKRNEFMKAKGRGELDIADSPFAAAVLQAEQGIRRSSRNVLANVEANLAAKMNGGFVKNGLTDFTKTETDSNGLPIYAEVVEGVDVRHVGTDYEFAFSEFAFSDGDKATASSGASLVANRPDIHLFKRDGKLYAIRYRVGNNGRGIDVAKAFSGENMGHWGDGLQWVPRITHWLSSMRTQYSPEFTVSNMLADNLEALQALVGRYGLWDGGKAFMKSLQFQFRNARDLWRYVKTGEARGRVKSAIDAGILTKGGVVSQGIDAETKELTTDLDKFIRKQKRLSEMNSVDMAKSFGRNVVDYISMANSFAEYSTRIGIVSALEEYGVPRKDAIKFARDATVNFNRKGTAMPYINGLYMFANAAVQGAMRSVQSFRDDFSNAAKPSSGQLGHNKHKGELVGMLVAIGVAKAILDNALGDDDDREKEGGRNARNLTEYDRKHNVGVPIGGGRQLAPLRFRGPYAAIPYLAQTFTRYALGDIDEGDVGAILASELGAQATDLLGGNGITNSKGEVDGSLLMQSIAPTLIDPVVQWATGKDYKGDNRLRRKFDNTMPASSNGKRSTPDVYKSIAQVINSLTGGNENRIGKLDIAPEDLQLIIEFLGGAPMRDINNVVSSVKNVGELASGGAPDKTLSQMPFVRRVVREYPDVTGRYYDAIEMYERDKMEYKKTTRLEERRELRKSKPYLSTANTQLDKMIEQVKELTHLENGEVKRGRKWVAPKIERSEAQKNAYRKRRLRLQAAVLKRLGE